MYSVNFDTIESRFFADCCRFRKFVYIGVNLLNRKLRTCNTIQKPVGNRRRGNCNPSNNAWNGNAAKFARQLTENFCTISVDAFCHRFCSFYKI